MKPQIFLAGIFLAIVFSGCTVNSLNPVNSFLANDINPHVKSGAYRQKTNTFFVINDSSSSMNDTYLGADLLGLSNLNYSKHGVEKELLMRMNNTIPDIPLDYGVSSFGSGPCLSWSFSKLNQPLETYTERALDLAIWSLECAGGGTPVAKAIDSANADLSAAPGNIAVILLSDGYQYSFSPINAAARLKEQYGDRLCIYTIWVGNHKEVAGQANLKELAEISGCGFSTTVHAIAAKKGMEDFVTKVFFDTSVPAKPVPVEYVTIEGDADNDGVVDSKDDCPDTPAGASVNFKGCWVIKGIHFANDKSNIESQYYELLDNVVKVIKNNPGLEIQIQGHTDSSASPEYNMALSERRAHAVKDYLGAKTGKFASLTAKGYGLTRPIDTNKTMAGRRNNRRVQLAARKKP